MGDFDRLILDAQAARKRWPDRPIFQYYRFAALTALGQYDPAAGLFQEIVRSTPAARNALWSWAAKCVFDTLAAGRSWHPPDRERGEGVPPLRGAGILPAIRGRDALATKEQGQDALATSGRPWQPPDGAPTGAAFLPLIEAEETYRELSAKGHRVTTDGFSAEWSPDGKKLAFSMGVIGNSGVALLRPRHEGDGAADRPGQVPPVVAGRQVHCLRPGPPVSARPGIRGPRPQEPASWPGRSRGLAHEIRTGPSRAGWPAASGPPGARTPPVSTIARRWTSYALFDLHRGGEG